MRTVLVLGQEDSLSAAQKLFLQKCADMGVDIQYTQTDTSYHGHEISHIWFDEYKDLLSEEAYAVCTDAPKNKPHGPTKQRKGKTKRW